MRRLTRLFGRGVTVAALALLVTAIGCAPGKKSVDPPSGAISQAKGPGMAEITVQAVPVQVGALVVEHQTSGTVKPVMQSQVVGQVSGVVARVARKAGDWVARDDTVIQLDDSQLKLSVKTAQASLEAARINLSTGQDTTKQANPRLDLQVRSAESALSVAQRNYDGRQASSTSEARRAPTLTGRKAISTWRRRTSRRQRPPSTRTRRPTCRTSPSSSLPSTRRTSLSSRRSSTSSMRQYERHTRDGLLP